MCFRDWHAHGELGKLCKAAGKHGHMCWNAHTTGGHPWLTMYHTGDKHEGVLHILYGIEGMQLTHLV